MEQHAAEIAGEEESWQQAGGECLNVMLEEEEEEEEDDDEEYEVMEEEEPETGENVPPSMSLASLSARLGNIHIGINAGGTKKTNTRKRRDFLGEALTVVPQEKAEERTSGLDEIKQEADRIEDEVAREDEEDGEDEEWVPPGRENNRVSKKRREPTGQAYSKTRTRTTRTRTAQRGAVMIDLTSSITAASKNTIRSDNGERNDNSGAAATVAGAAAKARLKRKKKQCNRLLAQAKTFARDLDWRASLDKYLLARALLQQLGSDVSSSMSAKVAKKIRRARLKLGFDADKEELREAQDAWAEKQRCEGHDTGEGCIDLLNENQNVLDADDGVNATSREPLCWDATSVQDMALLVNASAAEDAPSISPATLDATEFSIPLEHYQKLFPHQRRGVRWMWSLYKNGHGGILADDVSSARVSFSLFISLCIRLSCRDVVIFLGLGMGGGQIFFSSSHININYNPPAPLSSPNAINITTQTDGARQNCPGGVAPSRHDLRTPSPRRTRRLTALGHPSMVARTRGLGTRSSRCRAARHDSCPAHQSHGSGLAQG